MEKGLWIKGGIETKGGPKVDVISPLDEKVIGQLELYDGSDLDELLKDVKAVQTEWKNITLKNRAKIFYKFITLLERDREEIAEIIHKENGKTMEEALASVDKAIELTEFSCSLPAVAWGNTEEVSSGITVTELKEPVGTVLSIVPFNFPLMVPMWTIPTSLVLGNAIVLKPSTSTPFTLYKIGELLKEAGLPDGLFTLLPGDRELVNKLIDSKYIDAVTFVGSTPVAEIVYKRSSQNLKRCLALGGAKNFIIVSPETDPEITAKEICSAAFGMTGQRCMAASVVVVVGENQALVDEIIEISKNLQTGDDMGPLIDSGARSEIERFLKDNKGKVLYNGLEDSQLPEKGYYVGPSVVEYEKYDDMWEDEVFGPTIEIIHAETIEEALEYQNSCEFGNGASIFTDLGEVSLKCSEGLTAGMVGVNIGVPVPRDPFAFGGIKLSKFGHGDITGKSSIEFLTNTKKVTTKWNHQNKVDWMS